MFSSFNPIARPPSRNDRGGAAKVRSLFIDLFLMLIRCALQNYFPAPSGFSVQVFKAPALPPRPYAAKVDVDYRPMARVDSQSRQQSGHVSRQQEATRKLLKASPLPPGEPGFAKRSYDHKHGSGGYAIHAGPMPDTYIYERSVSSKSEYRYPHSDITTECDSIFSVNTQISSGSSSSSVTDSPPNTRMLQVRATSPISEHTRVRSPSYQPRNATTFPPGHSCPSCGEAGPPCRPSSTTANKGDYGPYPSRPLPTPPVSARVRKDSILLASERSRPSDDAAAYARQHPTSQLSRSSSLKGNLSIGIPPPPGLDIAPGGHYEYATARGPVLDIEAVYHPPNSTHRRNSDGDHAQILPPRPIRSNTIPPARSVRWCDDLICPSPILPSERRKGWFNRRGFVSL